MYVGHAKIPSKGELIEQHQTGVTRLGYVWYADQLQVLVKWHDGKSSSLRFDRDNFSILATDEHAQSWDERSAQEVVTESRATASELARVAA